MWIVKKQVWSAVPELREICDVSELLREWPQVDVVPHSELSDLESNSIILRVKI